MKLRKQTSYNVHLAKTHLSELLERVADGEDVVISKAGVPVARLVPVVRTDDKRPLGSEKGRIQIEDDFDAPLPSSVLDAFDT